MLRVTDQIDNEKGTMNIHDYHMPKIYCHINQCNATVQYFALLHILRLRAIALASG